jgi:hypothetical protein
VEQAGRDRDEDERDPVSRICHLALGGHRR